jgi:hypothetical protein
MPERNVGIFSRDGAMVVHQQRKRDLPNRRPPCRTRRHCRIGFGLAFAILSSCLPVQAEESHRWLGDLYDGGASLIYGVPESDDVPIAFTCELPSRALIVSLPLGADFQPRNEDIAITITAPPGSERMALTGRAQFFEEMGVAVFEARGRFDVALARMLKQGRELHVAVGGTTLAFPLAGAAQAMSPLEGACARPQ